MKIQIKRSMNWWPTTCYTYAIRAIANSFTPYHPVALGGKPICAGERTCQDRWNLIKPHLEASGARTLLDLGCAEGYFVMKAAAECNCVALGVDADVRRLAIAQAAATINCVKGAGFLYGELDPAFIADLPAFDAVLFLSVLHHVMYERGEEYAREYMKGLRQKVRGFLVFDMGQSNEVNNAWAKLLPDMGSDPHSWICEFLRSTGFSGVEKIGETDSYHANVPRALFRLVP